MVLQLLRTILLIILGYWIYKVAIRLFSPMFKGKGRQGGQRQKTTKNTTGSSRSRKKPNFRNTDIEDADYEEIKDL